MRRARRVPDAGGTTGATHLSPVTLSTRCSNSALGIAIETERPSVAPTSSVSAAVAVHIEQSGMCAATGYSSADSKACNAHPTANSRCEHSATRCCWSSIGSLPHPAGLGDQDVWPQLIGQQYAQPLHRGEHAGLHRAQWDTGLNSDLTLSVPTGSDAPGDRSGGRALSLATRESLTSYLRRPPPASSGWLPQDDFRHHPQPIQNVSDVAARCRSVVSADCAHPVSTSTIRSRIEPPLGGAPKNSRDLAPVSVPMAAPTSLRWMAARLAT